MGKIEELTQKRREAYEYIRQTAYNRMHAPKDVTDAQLADILGGTLELTDSIRLLREGKHNPTKRLVQAFKREFKNEILESTIDAYLVIPFRNA